MELRVRARVRDRGPLLGTRAWLRLELRVRARVRDRGPLLGTRAVVKVDDDDATDEAREERLDSELEAGHLVRLGVRVRVRIWSPG